MAYRSRTSVLRLAQAHQPLFYLPHAVADAVGAFRRRSLTVELVPMKTSGQWQLLTTGAADIAVGGPMRSMRLFEQGQRLVTFAAAVATSPWVLVGPFGDAGIGDVRELVGRTVFDDEEIATGRLCLRGLLAARGSHDALDILPMPRDDLMLRVASGLDSLALVPYESIVHLEHRGVVRVVANLADWTGRVPWSAYQALPETLERRREEVTEFVAAIDEALGVIADESAERLADIVAPWLPGLDHATFVAAVHGYHRRGVWAATPIIPRDEFDRFASLLVVAGWVRATPPYEQLVMSAMGD